MPDNKPHPADVETERRIRQFIAAKHSVIEAYLQSKGKHDDVVDKLAAQFWQGRQFAADIIDGWTRPLRRRESA